MNNQRTAGAELVRLFRNIIQLVFLVVVFIILAPIIVIVLAIRRYRNDKV